MTGFKVPADLAARKDLTLEQVLAIVAIRARRKTLQSRHDALPAKAEQYLAEITKLEGDEDLMLEEANARAEA